MSDIRDGAVFSVRLLELGGLSFERVRATAGWKRRGEELREEESAELRRESSRSIAAYIPISHARNATCWKLDPPRARYPLRIAYMLSPVRIESSLSIAAAESPGGRLADTRREDERAEEKARMFSTAVSSAG